FNNPMNAIGVHKVDGKWRMIPPADRSGPPAKVHGLQGPIDDAFMGSFLNVAPTGKVMNPQVGGRVEKEMKHATDQWRKQFSGVATTKKDTEVTDEDIKNNNLVLWGDPQSNAVYAKIADKLPIRWLEKGVNVGQNTYPVLTHVPVLIYPNPLNPARYVVLN